MKVIFKQQNNTEFSVDLSRPLDISIPLCSISDKPKAWFAPDFEATPHQNGNFIGSVEKGSPVNFYDIKLNPHGNGTHTECVGHITDRPFTINQCLRRFWFYAKLISIRPEELSNGDQVITLQQVKSCIENTDFDALIVRSLPNTTEKKHHDYSGTNPPYFETEVMKWLADNNISHFLTDLPSVDKEQDEGQLAGHKAYWNFPGNIREDATITELIYVPNSIPDGNYMLNLQIISLEMDASPSKPVLYGVDYE